MQKEVYKGQIIRVTEEEMNNAIWERCFVPDGVIVFPITDEGKIVLIEEVRPHETPNIRLKPVSGILEPDLELPLKMLKEKCKKRLATEQKNSPLSLPSTLAGQLIHPNISLLPKT